MPFKRHAKLLSIQRLAVMLSHAISADRKAKSNPCTPFLLRGQKGHTHILYQAEVSFGRVDEVIKCLRYLKRCLVLCPISAKSSSRHCLSIESLLLLMVASEQSCDFHAISSLQLSYLSLMDRPPPDPHLYKSQ